MHRDNEQANAKNFAALAKSTTQLMDTMNRVGRILEIHEQHHDSHDERLDRLGGE